MNQTRLDEIKAKAAAHNYWCLDACKIDFEAVIAALESASVVIEAARDTGSVHTELCITMRPSRGRCQCGRDGIDLAIAAYDQATGDK